MLICSDNNGLALFSDWSNMWKPKKHLGTILQYERARNSFSTPTPPPRQVKTTHSKSTQTRKHIHLKGLIWFTKFKWQFNVRQFRIGESHLFRAEWQWMTCVCSSYFYPVLKRWCYLNEHFPLRSSNVPKKRTLYIYNYFWLVPVMNEAKLCRWGLIKYIALGMCV